MENKILVFDMDGTIVDLYGQKNWLDDLRSENPNPYRNAKPIFEMKKLNTICSNLKSKGYKIVVTSWLAKQSTVEYKNKVRNAKKDWLAEYDFPYDEIHLVQYGTPKSTCTKKYREFVQILVDDEEKNLSEFTRKAQHFGIKATSSLLTTLESLE
jgi:5'(3')-deoxyribonucleotidase